MSSTERASACTRLEWCCGDVGGPSAAFLFPLADTRTHTGSSGLSITWSGKIFTFPGRGSPTHKMVIFHRLQPTAAAEDGEINATWCLCGRTFPALHTSDLWHKRLKWVSFFIPFFFFFLVVSASPPGRGPCDTEKIKTGRGRSGSVCVGGRQGGGAEGGGQIVDASKGGREAGAARDRGTGNAMQHLKK